MEKLEPPEGHEAAPKHDHGTDQPPRAGGDAPSATERTDLAAVISGFAGALTAAAALVVVPGSAALLARLDHADLPTDVGVVVSLPPEFLLATGLTYLLFPLIAAVGLTLVVVLIPGRGGMANPALLPRPAPTETPSGSSDAAGSERRQGLGPALWWRFLNGGWLIVLFVAFTVPALMLAEDLSPHPVLALAALVTVGGLLFTLSKVLVGRRVDNLASIALTAVVAAAFFLPGAVLFAASRAFPTGTVCVGVGQRVDGVLIGEADSRVYVGEADIRVAVFIAGGTRSNDARTTLRNADWDVRRPPSPQAVGLERLDLVVADITSVEPQPAGETDESSVPPSPAAEEDESRALDDEELARVLEERVPIFAMTNDTELGNAAEAAGVDRVAPESAATHDDLALFGREVLDAEVEEQAGLDEDERRAQPERRILSIPSSKVDRILIGGEGSCPGESEG